MLLLLLLILFLRFVQFAICIFKKAQKDLLHTILWAFLFVWCYFDFEIAVWKYSQEKTRNWFSTLFSVFFPIFFLFYLVVDIVVSKACCISSIISNIFYSRVLKTENCKIFDVIMSFIVVCWPNDWNSFLLFWIVRIFFFFLSAFTCLQHKSNENKNIYMISHHSIHLFKFCFMFTIHILKLLFIHTLE